MAKKNLENKLLVVVRVRGTNKVRQSITETMNRLNLRHVNNLVLLYGNKPTIGMLNKCKDFLTYGEVSKEILTALLENKGVKTSDEMLESISSGKKSAKELNIEIPIRMPPPKHGYENTKQGYTSNGALGYRGEEINLLIKRML